MMEAGATMNEQYMSDRDRIKRLEKQVEVLHKAIGLLVVSASPTVKWMDRSWEQTK